MCIKLALFLASFLGHGLFFPASIEAQISKGFTHQGDTLIFEGRSFPALRHSQRLFSTTRSVFSKTTFTRPIYLNPENQTEFTVTNSVLIKWKMPLSPTQVDSWGQVRGLKRNSQLDDHTFSLEFLDPASDPIARCLIFSKESEIAWAEPEILSSLQKHFTPNDPYFPWQWGLQNTGQNSLGAPGADIKADSAWNLEQGDSTITIAILDDGVETAHPDLAANIRAGGRNYSGVGTFTDPNPSHANDKHGTSVAGVAAGIGNNGLGATGIAPKVKILPIKISTGTTWASSASLAQAIRWAADTVDADILSCSWGLSVSSSAVSDAIRDASVRGRSPGTVGIPGKGSLVFFSSGNLGTDFTLQSIPIGSFVAAGSYQIGLRYQKSGGGSFEDRMCIDNVNWVTGTSPSISETFANEIPIGWVNDDTHPWILNDAIFYSGAGDRKSICSGIPLGNGGSSEIRLPLREYSSGDFLDFHLRRSSEANDGLQIRFYNASGALVNSTLITGGVDTHTAALGFPASVDSSISVGASSEYDFRVDYSQYAMNGTGKQIDFVAPGSGVWKGVITTDRTGISGYDTSDFTGAFGGTSASCPLIAGLGALILSRNPNLTRDQALDLLRNTSDKIGGVTYSGGYAGGTHIEYGYGRVNALKALASLDLTPIFSPLTDTTLNENQILQFPLLATDPDGDSIQFSMLHDLAGDTLIGNLFQWKPEYSDSGSTTLRFIATDGVKSDTETVLVTVYNVDRPPEITALANLQKDELDSVIFNVTAFDPDGDAITITADFLPTWASFDGMRFLGYPGYLDSGSYSIRFRAMARGITDTAWMMVTVHDIGTGLGTLRLLTNTPGTLFHAMPAGWGESGLLGMDSVNVKSLVPGWYSFSASAPGKRNLHFSMQAFRDSIVAKRVSLSPSIPIAFAAPETVWVNGSPYPFPDSAVITLGDLNADGREDILIVGKTQGPIVLVNTDSVPGSGSDPLSDRELNFALNTSIPFNNLDSALASASLLDWNFDSHLDLLVSTLSGEVYVLLGSQTGFTLRQNLLTLSGQAPRALTEDWDLDGRPDIWIRTATKIWVYRNIGTLANPALSSTPVEILDATGASLPSTGTGMLLDLNGDEIKDLVYASDSQLVFRQFNRLPSGSVLATPTPRLVNTEGLASLCRQCQVSARIPKQGLPRMLIARPNHPLVYYPSGILGDLNRDKRVDALDRDALLLKYDLYQGDSDWMTSYNLWVDGKGIERIDIKDFAEMADSWGKME